MVDWIKFVIFIATANISYGQMTQDKQANTTDTPPVDKISLKNENTTSNVTSNNSSDTRIPRDVFLEAMKTYDKRLRPEGLVTVTLNMQVMSFDSLQETAMKYTMDFYFAQIWTDSRLKLLPGRPDAIINIAGNHVEEFWLPDTVFINSKHSTFHKITVDNRYLSLDLSQGAILYHARITTTASCRMDLRYYPMDEQTCYLAIESYGYDAYSLVYQWYYANNTKHIKVFDTEMSNYDVISAVKSAERTKYHAEMMSSATAQFTFHRRRQYFIIQVYIPCIFIVMVTWISFWITPTAVPARSGICVTSILTLITMLGITNSNMPKVSYVKALDLYLFFSLVFVFSTLVEYVIVLNYKPNNKTKRKISQCIIPLLQRTKTSQQLLHRKNADKAFIYNVANNDEKNQECNNKHGGCQPECNNKKPAEQEAPLSPGSKKLKESSSHSPVDRVAKILFPSTFIIFNVVYWAYYLTREKSMKIESLT